MISATFARILGVMCGFGLLALLLFVCAMALRPALRHTKTSFVLLGGLMGGFTLVKLGLLFVFPGFRPDVTAFEYWGTVTQRVGPAHIYDPAFLCKYAPGYLYPLWAAAALARLTHTGLVGLRVFVEAPAVLSDLLLSLIIFGCAGRVGLKRSAFWAAVLFMLNPPLFYTSVVWGQNDSPEMLAILLAALMATESRYALAAAMAAVAIAIKAQGLVVIPVLGFWMLLRATPRQWMKAALAFAATMAVVIAPFQIGRPWNWIFQVYGSSLGLFKLTSVNAFNLMALVFGMNRPDEVRILGPVSQFSVGMALLAANYAFAAWLLWKERGPWGLLYAVFLSYLGLFVLGPRIHERYLYFALALLGPFALEAPVMLVVAAVLSITMLWNLIYVRQFIELGIFLSPRDPFGIAPAVANVFVFALASCYGICTVSRTAVRLPGGLRRIMTPFGLEAGRDREARVAVAAS